MKDIASLENDCKLLRYNLNKQELCSLKALESDPGLVIKLADKRGEGINSLLNNQERYEKMASDATDHIKGLIHIIVTEANNMGFISDETCKFQIAEENRAPIF